MTLQHSLMMLPKYWKIRVSMRRKIMLSGVSSVHHLHRSILRDRGRKLTSVCLRSRPFTTQVCFLPTSFFNLLTQFHEVNPTCFGHQYSAKGPSNGQLSFQLSTNRHSSGSAGSRQRHWTRCLSKMSGNATMTENQSSTQTATRLVSNHLCGSSNNTGRQSGGEVPP